MIGRLNGILLEKQPPFVLVEVAGVGYECQAPMNTVYNLPEVGEKVVLHTHLSISENAHTLFAFYSLEERTLFRELIKVNGVGPKLALAILSGMSAIEFVQHVHHGEVATLVKIPGVGKKTAERLVVEMKDRLKDWEVELPAQASGSQSSKSVESKGNVEEAISGLVALGYKPTDASKAISQLEDDSLPSATLIRLALKQMI
ncbi:Holliday junction branch migration protein RuvA [Aliikangiella marina]|uniref:Holliday junction branch migration complex subunit RuvA n=1 Tax=Aliikangiella marina TaxID=1712262 RepID=A0A545T703_9GAMM|nr:Holliday junction branch migration protein RuvA [Aliikangiella marina]TQV73004.1 Holliday junction branch migration protein RuvA [Aliikangiella marina]